MSDLRSPATDLFGDPIESQPLWFKAESFLSKQFDAEAYVAELRSFVPLDGLAKELRAHLAALKAELVELINRDYADFVSLSTRLIDVDAAAARMRSPLMEFKEKVAAFREVVDSALTALRSGLKQRAEASAAREMLQLLLDTFHVVSKVEKLIREVNTENYYMYVENGTNLREDQSILLERIASEINRLNFYMSHAKNLPFIENMEKRIQSATSLLDNSLEKCFVDGLKHQDVKVIYNCLRAYAAIDNTSGAEEIFRTTIVSPLIQKVIHQSQTQGVDNESAGIEEDYEKIRELIQQDCKFIIDISSSANSGLHVFDFLANSILKEVLTGIQKGKPGVFSAGRPAEFLKSYKASLSFLAFLEGYCPSRSSVSRFRSQAVYVDFMRQWNVGVYFSLRFQEIAGTLDSALMATHLIPVRDSNNSLLENQLILKQSATLLESLRSCWRDDILVHSHADKFLRLSLQLLSRYATWLSSGLGARKARTTNINPPPNSEWVMSAQIEDFVYVMHDVTSLVSEVSGNYLEYVLQVLDSCSIDVTDLIKKSILQSVKSLEDLLPAIVDTMIEALVEKPVEVLKQLRGITAAHRMMNRLPERHSTYVSGILRPLKIFLDGEHMRFLTQESRKELVCGAAERITSRYYDIASEVVNVARKTESSLMKLRQGAQRRVGASLDISENNISDTEKTCMQLFLDIQEYGRNLAAVGVQAADIPAYRSLWQCVAPEDKQAVISF